MSNLCFIVGWKRLKQVFQMAGTVRYAVVWRDKAGKSSHVGTVSFKYLGDATHVMAVFNGQILWGRPIQVRMNREIVLYRDGAVEACVEPQ